MTRVFLNIIFLIVGLKQLDVLEKLQFFKTHKLINQVFGGYLLHWDAKVIEYYKDDDQNVEQNFPIEFVNLFQQFSVNKFEIDYGYGNPADINDIPQLDFIVRNPGFSLKVYQSKDLKEYKKFCKFLSGFFFTEIQRASLDFLPVQNIIGEKYMYHNSGYNALNTVVLKKFLEFASYNDKLLIAFFLDHMKAFESDYISIGIKAEKIDRGIQMKFSLTVMMREFLIDQIFKGNSFRLNKNQKFYFKRQNIWEEVFKDKDLISKFDIIQLSKKSKKLYSLQGKDRSTLNIIKFENYFQHFSNALKNNIIINIENTSDDKNLDFKLHLFFATNQYPLVSKFQFIQQQGYYKITQRDLYYQQSQVYQQPPSTIISLQGQINSKSKFQIVVPFQNVFSNFETIDFDFLIQITIPSFIIEYKEQDQNTFVQRHFNNLAYKQKNYDQTMVFGIMSVYLVAIFLLFNTVLSIKTSNQQIKNN